MSPRPSAAGTTGKPLKPVKHNLFLALHPDSAAIAQISGLIEQFRVEHTLAGKSLEGRFHVTLYWLGEYPGEVPESVIAMARQAATALTVPPFEILFDQVRTVPIRSKPLVLYADGGNAELKAFYKALGQALVQAGLGQWAKGSLKPHLTLLYDGKVVPATAVNPVRWTARELVLISSPYGATRHDRLGAWPFRA